MMSRIAKFKRSLELAWVKNPVSGSAALFLWGARQTGKTTFLRDRYPGARFYDLLDTSLAAELAVRPRILREEILAERPRVVIIDEVQHAPSLLQEVHWLLENVDTHFILCGSSARKLRRRSRNLLGGRVIDFHLLPLTTHEIDARNPHDRLEGTKGIERRTRTSPQVCGLAYGSAAHNGRWHRNCALAQVLPRSLGGPVDLRSDAPRRVTDPPDSNSPCRTICEPFESSCLNRDYLILIT